MMQVSNVNRQILSPTLHLNGQDLSKERLIIQKLLMKTDTPPHKHFPNVTVYKKYPEYAIGLEFNLLKNFRSDGFSTIQTTAPCYRDLAHYPQIYCWITP
jgi:hypothetical protein